MDKQKQERSEDFEQLTKKITKGIRREILAALAPRDEKQKKFEDDQNIIFQEQITMKGQLASIQKQLTDLRSNRLELFNLPLQVLLPTNQKASGPNIPETLETQ